MFQLIMALLWGAVILVYAAYLTLRLNKISRELDGQREELKKGLIRETASALSSDEPKVLPNDLQKIVEYSPSKKERQRRKRMKDGER